MSTSITGQGISIYPAPDDALSSTSKNPVQNKVIDEEITDVKNAISYIEDAVIVEEKTTTVISSPNIVDTAKLIDSNGDVVSSAYNLNIWEIPIDGNSTGVGFRVITGFANYIAFYNAESYAQCSSVTLVSKVQYTNDTINEIPFPDGATICLINYRTFYSGYLYANIKEFKYEDDINELKSDVAGITTATESDEGKVLKAKTVTNGKVTEWEFGDTVVIDPTLSQEGEAADAKVVGDALNLLIEDKVTKDYISTPNVVDTYKYINADGSITESAYSLNIWAIPIDSTKTGVCFNVIKGVANYAAFYTADTYAGCNASTCISSTRYANNTDVELAFPQGATICLINYRTFQSGYLYTNEKVAKSVVEIEAFQTKLNTEIGTTMTVADLGLFVRGRLNVTTGEVISSDYQCINPEDFQIDRNIQYNFDSDAYNVSVYYRNGDGTYSNNGGLTTEKARTILKGSSVKFKISKKGSIVKLTDGELISLPQAITFNTAFEDWKEYVNDNCDYEAVCAKMYEKGASEKSFSNAVGILVAGQSNIDGRVPSGDLPSDIVPPFANIKASINSITGNFSSSMSLPSAWGVDFSLYDALNKLGQDFYVIKWAVGGTSISPYGTGTQKWTPFYEELSSISNSLLWSFETQIRACLANNPNTFNPRALIWHQGEGDYSGESKKAALDYYKNFKCLIAYIRGIVGNERLPVIYGTISHNSGQYCPVVEEAQLKIAQEDPYAYCIDMSGASLIDAFHFDADACVYFGRMAYDALIDFGVISGTKIDPTRPW